MSKFIGNSITLPNLATAPSSPTAGDVYYNTTENKPYSYNGTAWVLLVPSASGAMNYAQTQATKQSGISADGVTIVSTSITTSGYPVQVMVTGDAENSAVGAWVKLQLYRGSTAIGKIIHVEGSAGSENIPYALTVIDAPSAGTYTYALKTASAVAGGTYNFGETDGPVLTAIELSGATGAGGGSGDITSVVAGAGLTGGATSGEATLTVGAGTGITVNADDIAVDAAVVATLTGTQTLTNKTITDPQVTGKIVIDNNGATPFNLSNASGTTIQAVSNDGADTRIVLDAHGTGVHGALTIRSSRGTAGSPSAVQGDDKIGEMGARGYGDTGFSTSSVARVAMYANENWTDTAQGTRVTIEATQNGSTGAEQVATFTAGSGGGINLLAGREVKINGNSVLSSNTLGSGIVNSSLTSVGTISSGSWQGTSVGVAYGGTGATDAQGARTAILPAQTSANDKFLRSDGTDVSWQNFTVSITNETIDGGGA